MRRLVLTAIMTLVGIGCTPASTIPQVAGKPAVDQGPDWTLATRASFYSQDQGSQIMPLRWMQALKQPNGDPFLADDLTRYGYLANAENPTSRLPVGFTAAGPLGGEVIGMTCAACHTRQIEVQGTAYRIDGGPAIADFQSFLTDLDTAVNAVIADATAFQEFAAAVLGQPPTPADEANLMADLKAWYLRYDTLMQRALPASPWGPSRLDAVAMIFNRLTGLDLGPPPTYLIANNIMRADAPVRYPFLWNAAIQDKTQWPGFADNGDTLLGLARNLGEVFGVFATFHPAKDLGHPLLKINYLGVNSANFEGLDALEHLIRKIGPPKFPWKIDAALARQGEAIFARDTAQGGCAACHAITPGRTRPIDEKTWATPIMDVGTDSLEVQHPGPAGLDRRPQRRRDSGHFPAIAADRHRFPDTFDLGGGLDPGEVRSAHRGRTSGVGAIRRACEPRRRHARGNAGGAAVEGRVQCARARDIQGPVACAAGDLGDGALPAQRIGAHPGGSAEARRATARVLPGWSGLRSGRRWPCQDADQVQLHAHHDRLHQPELRQQPMRPRIRHQSYGRGKTGAAGIPEAALTRRGGDQRSYQASE